MEHNVCAVIITFRPVPEHLENALKARDQVQKLVVVDNGSSDQALAPFRAAAQEGKFHLIENGENLGIAAALNTGIKWAKSQGCEWVILFDQDSTVTDGLIEKLLSAYYSDPDREHIGTIVPTYIDRVSRNEMPVELSKTGEILTVSTSSSLIPQSVFERCGYFREDFVIDQIDYEFCLRIVAAGYRIVQSARRNSCIRSESGKSMALGANICLTRPITMPNGVITSFGIELFCAAVLEEVPELLLQLIHSHLERHDQDIAGGEG